MADQQRVHTWVTYALIAANVAMFGVELASGVSATNPTPQSMLDLGASFPPLTLAGEPWRLATAMFLHFGLLHIALNMLCLWQGRMVEVMYGRAAFAVIYLLAGLGGGIATLVRSTNAVSAGASGAVFGIYGAFAAFLVLRRHAMPEQVWKTAARGIGMFIVINLAFGLSVSGISVAAHVGGLVYGFALGYALLWKTAGKPRAPRIAAVAVAAAALVTGVFALLPRPATHTELQELATVEEQVLPRLAAIDAKRASHELDDAHAAYQLEHDVIAPWRVACSAVVNADVSAALRPRYDAVAAYCSKRQEAWEVLGAALVATDRKDALMERYRFLEVELRTLAYQLKTTFETK